MSRDLDAEVAEKVMGLHHEPEFGIGWWKKADGAEPLRSWRLPRYSTSIADAWLVVEKMHEHPDATKRTLRLTAHPYNRTYASFSPSDADVEFCEGNGQHATPLAICRAALEAVNYER